MPDLLHLQESPFYTRIAMPHRFIDAWYLSEFYYTYFRQNIESILLSVKMSLLSKSSFDYIWIQITTSGCAQLSYIIQKQKGHSVSFPSCDSEIGPYLWLTKLK